MTTMAQAAPNTADTRTVVQDTTNVTVMVLRAVLKAGATQVEIVLNVCES